MRELLRSAEKAAKPLGDAMKQFDALSKKESRAEARSPTLPTYTGPRSIPLDLFLRPPGAQSESKFRETCSRCARCVEVCPAQCIRLDNSGAQGHGVPYIDADLMPCVVCESLACMNTCPSGALSPIPMFEIDMGTAVWREDRCIRSKNEECRICVEKCPLGTAAIDLSVDGREVLVNPLGCIGCGVCQHYCPTSPKAITVIPAAARSND